MLIFVPFGPLWEEKQFLLIFVPFYWFDNKHKFKQVQIFLRICPFSHLLKNNFLCISVLFSEVVNFWTKKRSCLWISPKKLQNNRKVFLSVCGSLCGEKQFLLTFVPFYWFDQKHLFKQIQIFLRICPFSHLLRKTNFLCISVFFSEILSFWTKKRSFLWITPKMLQNKRKTLFSCMWYTLRRKTCFC